MVGVLCMDMKLLPVHVHCEYVMALLHEPFSRNTVCTLFISLILFVFIPARENELRKLRKVNTEFEEQNAILSKHIENMKKGIDKLEGERKEQQNEISALQRHLAKLRQIISRSFVDIQIPGVTDPLTSETVDSFVAKLQQYIQENSKENLELTSRIKDIIASLDYPK